MSDTPTAQSLYDELDTVFNRHNELMRLRPDMVVALCINMADSLADKQNVSLHVEEISDGKWVVECGDNDAGAFLGFERDRDTGEILPSDMPDDMQYTDEVDP